MEWQKKIGSCFEGSAFIFAGNSTAEKNALDLLFELRKKDILWEEVAVEFAQYLLSNRCDARQIDEQIIRIQERYLPWLR